MPWQQALSLFFNNFFNFPKTLTYHKSKSKCSLQLYPLFYSALLFLLYIFLVFKAAPWMDFVDSREEELINCYYIHGRNPLYVVLCSQLLFVSYKIPHLQAILSGLRTLTFPFDFNGVHVMLEHLGCAHWPYRLFLFIKH